MNSINSEILSLAKSITEKLEQPSDSESEFEIKSPRKRKTKVEHIFKIPKLPSSCAAPKHNIHLASVDLSLENMNTEKEEKRTDKTEENTNYKPLSLPSQFSAMKQTEINANNFLTLEDISEDEELWLIMTPKDCKLKKQKVEMEGRHELKGGKFEIEFFRRKSENNMVTLVCDNKKLVSGPHFKGCVQVSEKLQTFTPTYHDILPKVNLIPCGLKQRYVPFGADIDGVRCNKHKDTSKGHCKKSSASDIGFDIVDTKYKVLESQKTDSKLISETSPRKFKKGKSGLKRKHCVTESPAIPAIRVNCLIDSQDTGTEITLNSETSKKRKKKKGKSHHEDTE